MGMNLDRSGAARFFGGVHGRGGGLESLGGSRILVELSGRGTGRGRAGGEKTCVEPGAGAFSIGTSASFCAERERRGSFGRFVTGRQSCAKRSKSTTGRGRGLAVCFCLVVEGPECGRSELPALESVKSERKLGTTRDGGGRGEVVGGRVNPSGTGKRGFLLGENCSSRHCQYRWRRG